MDEKPKNLWKEVDDKHQLHVTIPTIDSTIESENVDERVVFIGDLEKRKQAYGICGELNSSDLSSFQFSSDANYTAQSTSANPISECLDVQLSELELNEICQDSEHNIE
ncbi:unnamed protein product [Rhizophagus irregularis]|uniref:Uncharacterized protein n=1 Tax=Rhizophagus irregularis TaxID=588596 RepID=A0A915YPD4_9GLOM|nr:unnamed protein product [Rhizophagus irregularis]CAB5304037.1 unnamed protein product [Rhizophagus irregularis]